MLFTAHLALKVGRFSIWVACGLQTCGLAEFVVSVEVSPWIECGLQVDSGSGESDVRIQLSRR